LNDFSRGFAKRGSRQSSGQTEGGKLTAVKYNTLDTGLLAQLMNDWPRLIEGLGGKVDRRCDGTALKVVPAHVNEQEIAGSVLPSRSLSLKQPHHLVSLDIRRLGLGSGKGRPPWRGFSRCCGLSHCVLATNTALALSLRCSCS
ncbi:hypothetical protein CT0861_02914, partial [Colletotrichum tofieldiae]